MKTLTAVICGTIVVASSASADDKPDVLVQLFTPKQVPTQQAPAQQDPPRQPPTRPGPTQQTPVQPTQQTPVQPTSAQRWTTTFSSETRYFSWRNNLILTTPPVGPGRGTEIYIPFAMQLTGKPVDTLNVDFVTRGGWVRANQSTPGQSGQVATTTDTVMSGTVTYLGWTGVQPFVALSANLPTGKSALLGAAANARMDPDFVDISTFGEGYNLGPSLGFNFPVTNSLLFTTSVGYTWRDSFERESGFPLFPQGIDPALLAGLIDVKPLQTINPGENATVTAAVNYQIGSFAVSLTGTGTWETPTIVEGNDTFKPGLRYLLALQSSYSWPEKLGKTTLSASFAHSNRNKVLLRDTIQLKLESLNSNSNVYRVGLEHLVPFGDFQVGPIGSVLYRDHNGYNSATLQFVPAKVRWSAGMLAQYAATPTVTLNARVEGVWTHERENPAADGGKLDALADGVIPASTVPAISGTGWQTSLGINVKL